MITPFLQDLGGEEGETSNEMTIISGYKEHLEGEDNETGFIIVSNNDDGNLLDADNEVDVFSHRVYSLNDLITSVDLIKNLTENFSIISRVEDSNKKYDNLIIDICDKYNIDVVAVKEIPTSTTNINQVSFKSDMKQSAIRIVSNKITKSSKTILLKLLRKHLPKDKFALINSLIDSPYGDVVIRGLLGTLITYLPKVNENPYAQKIAEEFRVSFASSIGDEELSQFTDMFESTIADNLSSPNILEDKTKFNIEEE